MKKSTIILIIVSFISVITLVAILIPTIMFASIGNPRIYYANFDGYSKDFKKVCAWVREYSGGEDVVLLYSTSTLTDETGFRDITNDRWVTVPDDIAESLRVISKEAWGSKTTFESVRVKGSRVYFDCDEYPYYVVYSPNGRPWRAFGKSVFSERICRNWYHVTRMK